jgi:hypothetical protein
LEEYWLPFLYNAAVFHKMQPCRTCTRLVHRELITIVSSMIPSEGFEFTSRESKYRICSPRFCVDSPAVGVKIPWQVCSVLENMGRGADAGTGTPDTIMRRNWSLERLQGLRKGVQDDLQVLRSIWFSKQKGGDHAARLESFYGPQAHACAHLPPCNPDPAGLASILSRDLASKRL